MSGDILRAGSSMKAFVRAALVVTLAFVAGPRARAAVVDWMDVEGRIRYGFYTEGARALGQVIAQFSTQESGADPLLHYYVGLANYRLAMVVATKDKSRATTIAR